jgi:hypothetical protein
MRQPLNVGDGVILMEEGKDKLTRSKAEEKKVNEPCRAFKAN